jgi:undecaprenyl-diphosphatase
MQPPSPIVAQPQPAESDMPSATDLFRRFDAAELAWCLRLNRGCARREVRALFALVSRLGNGVFWYTLILSLPLFYGPEAWGLVLQSVIVGLVGVALYKVLKSRLVRERPYISFDRIRAGTAALDRYSFPSGHTLHAVSFSILIVHSYPELWALCVPFTALTALSRVVLGLHYPTDVAAGGAIGAALALTALQVLL